MNLEDYEKIAGTGEGWVEAIKIFAKYESKGMESKIWFEVDHVVIYSPVGSDEVTADSEDGLALVALGWFLDSDSDVWSLFT